MQKEYSAAAFTVIRSEIRREYTLFQERRGRAPQFTPTLKTHPEQMEDREVQECLEKLGLSPETWLLLQRHPTMLTRKLAALRAAAVQKAEEGNAEKGQSWTH